MSVLIWPFNEISKRKIEFFCEFGLVKVDKKIESNKLWWFWDLLANWCWSWFVEKFVEHETAVEIVNEITEEVERYRVL